MQILSKLERKFGFLGIPNLTYFLIGGQVLAFMYLSFYPEQIVVMRQNILTFLFIPLSTSPLFAVFTWYLYYLYGRALEKEWGTFSYTLYVLIAYVATVVVSFLFPQQVLNNSYLYTSIFLAFAYLYPDFQLILLIFPVKVKWLAVFSWLWIGGSLLFGDLSSKALASVSVLNFVLFFGRDLIHFKKSSKVFSRAKPLHVCAVCGDDEIKNPKMAILYCKKCNPPTCYCDKHIKDHKHFS